MISTPSGLPIREGQFAAEIQEKNWGGKIRLVPPVVFSNITTRQRLCPNNPKRVLLIVSNQGPGNLVFGFSDPGLINSGIYVGAAGAVITLNVDEDGEMCASEWWGRSSFGVVTCAVWEYERV